MQKKSIFFFLLLLLPVWCFAQRCVFDDTQREVCLPRPAERVITLSPHTTELIDAIGAGKKVVGVITDGKSPVAKGRQIVGDYRGVSIEKILSLKPDLVVAWPSGNTAQTLAQLRRFGIEVYASEPAGTGGIVENLKELAALTGATAQIDRLLQEISAKKASLARRYGARKKIRAVLLISGNPLMTLTAKHAVNEAFLLCGAENIFADLPGIAPGINRESLLAARPELILTTFPVADRLAWLDSLGFKRANQPVLKALDADLILKPTPAMLDGIEQFCKAADRARERLRLQ